MSAHHYSPHASMTVMGSKKKSTRRQFLKGEAALDALQDLQRDSAADSTSDAELPASVRRQRQPPDYLVRVGRRAMACEFQVFLNAGQHAGAVEAASESLDLIDLLEEQLTVYRDHSEVMHINHHATLGRPQVEPRLFDLLSRCVQWHQATNGAFDITTGPLVKLWGFYTRQGRFPDVDEIRDILQRVGSQYLELSSDEQTIHFTRPGVELNLGSVGKGYALDRCAELLSAAGVHDYLLHGGQSSIMARGTRGADQDDGGWRVALRHPLRSERRLAELTLCNRGLGTSGSGQQFFYHRGRRYGHVLDPRTGFPADGVLSATVLAPTGAEADALATAFFVLGIDATRDFCQQRSDLSVLFVLPGSREGTVAIETIAMAPEHVTLLED